MTASFHFRSASGVGIPVKTLDWIGYQLSNSARTQGVGDGTNDFRLFQDDDSTPPVGSLHVCLFVCLNLHVENEQNWPCAPFYILMRVVSCDKITNSQ